jgi:hypothetical protein
VIRTLADKFKGFYPRKLEAKNGGQFIVVFSAVLQPVLSPGESPIGTYRPVTCCAEDLENSSTRAHKIIESGLFIVKFMIIFAMQGKIEGVTEVSELQRHSSREATMQTYQSCFERDKRNPYALKFKLYDGWEAGKDQSSFRFG